MPGRHVGEDGGDLVLDVDAGADKYWRRMLTVRCCDIAVRISGDRNERLARAAEPRRKVSSHLVLEQREVRFLTRLNAFSVTPRT